MAEPTYVIFLNGSYGVGKSAALEHLGDLLAELGRPFSLMDVDWYHRSWPPAADDPENVLTEAANLRAVWRNYRLTGPRQPVLAGVIRSVSERQRYEQVFDLPVRSVRLAAAPVVTQARLRGRYTEHQTRALDWHLARYAALSAQLADEDSDELVVDTDDLGPRAVAAAVLEHFGLLR